MPPQSPNEPAQPYLADPRFYQTLFDAAKNDDMESWLARTPYDFSPTTDDMPFFFQIQRLRWPSLSC